MTNPVTGMSANGQTEYAKAGPVMPLAAAHPAVLQKIAVSSSQTAPTASDDVMSARVRGWPPRMLA